MPFDRYEWLERVKAVEREYSAMRRAADDLLRRVRIDSSELGRDLRQRDLVRAADRLEATYVIRLFAEFETALREYWPVMRTTNPPNRVSDLIDGLASTCRIGTDAVRRSHEVRQYRNALVHERDDTGDALPIGDARSRLCIFLSRLR